jgi:hypothetical protein
MLTCIFILILLPLTFLGIVVKTLFSPAELAEMGIYLDDAWTVPSQSATPARLLKQAKNNQSGLASISICEMPRNKRVLC